MPQGASEDTAFILQKVYFFVTVSPNNTLPQSVLPRFAGSLLLNYTQPAPKFVSNGFLINELLV